MKEWECVKVKKHEEINKTINKWQKEGWCLHTYQATGASSNPLTTCYLKKASEKNESQIQSS